MNILGSWLSPCSPLISELAKSAILVMYFLTMGILDVIRVSSFMITSSFFMPTIMTAQYRGYEHGYCHEYVHG